jgi:hypothetical protein
MSDKLAPPEAMQSFNTFLFRIAVIVWLAVIAWNLASIRKNTEHAMPTTQEAKP